MISNISNIVVFIAILFCGPLKADWFVKCKDGLEIILTITKDLKEEKELFLASFSTAYTNNQQIINDIQEYKHIDLATFLQNSFKEDEDDFINSEKSLNTLFITAKTTTGKTVGYASFDKEENGCYIRQLAVDSFYKNKGIGTALVFSVLNIWQNITYLRLATRKANIPAIDFYKKLGFNSYDAVHDGLDPKIYCGLRKSLNKQLYKK